MTLNDLTEGVAVSAVHGPRPRITSITLDSRSAAPGAAFFAVRGAAADGHLYIHSAIEKGAAAIVCERLPGELDERVAYVQVADVHAVLGAMAANFYGHPSRKLSLVGITGTNGKTTTATLLHDLFRALGYRAGLISTVVYKVDGQESPAPNTTPDAITLNSLLARMVERGCDYCFMEVSSHGIEQGRVSGLTFAGGVFTNITHDHLDYHGTFAEYIRVKKSFFDSLPGHAFALVNADDRNAKVMVQNCRARVRTFAMKCPSDYHFQILETHAGGMLLNLAGREAWVRLIGRFNAYNLAGIYGAAVELGADGGEALRILSSLHSVAGRLQTLRSPLGVTAIVDYAHTPDALQNVLDTVNEIRTPDQKLYVVAGCGGDRDPAKRPVMARIAAEEGDLAILTSDNPRSEEPEEILSQMVSGLDPTHKYLRIADRREAIRAACALAAPGDWILVAGKGHETYQEVRGVRHHFDDGEEILKIFNK